MKSDGAAIPRYRPFDGPTLFRQGFRPFFLAAGLWGLAAVPLWLVVLQGAGATPTAFGPAAWHAHEMIFGFAAAVIAGFLLTAIPNWTGRLPLQGVPLIVLFGAWLAGRVAMSTSALIGPEIAAVLDLSFLALLLAVVLREIVSGRNWRNLPMAVALGGLLVANLLTHLDALDHASTAGLGQRLAIATIILLISLVGGRVVPSFTRNWLKKRGETAMPASRGMFDHVSLVLTLIALAAWTIAPDRATAGVALLAAGCASLARLARWRGHRTLAEPLVWSLHLGFAWVPVGLGLLGLAILRPEILPVSAGVHALTAGAIGSMTLAVMTRASLGHSGRALVGDAWTTAIYILIAAAAAVRTVAPIAGEFYGPALWASGLLWSAAFALFSLHYGRLLLSR